MIMCRTSGDDIMAAAVESCEAGLVYLPEYIDGHPCLLKDVNHHHDGVIAVCLQSRDQQATTQTVSSYQQPLYTLTVSHITFTIVKPVPGSIHHFLNDLWCGQAHAFQENRWVKIRALAQIRV
eukprot:CAMPEP_0117680324 /NCGR_PEP_ID=MMETSP0804-20121206/18289_1 /TAXON_ID=1074897 /ORGANISM="Tetraselmis astigmatica, Strain CCMP880" /LENGTH=122 /DNA_ID=CAMNT_0005489809 /DNA_START=593 /DNA_END=960 /DNA_ORIENTATION=+